MAQMPSFSRPHRKLTLVPKTLQAFAAIADGQKWRNARELQKLLESLMDKQHLKAGGDYRDRARGLGGSGGRTHAALLKSLGLWYEYEEDGEPIVGLTLAGEALARGENARPILSRQVMAHQFPSAYSEALRPRTDSRFRLRPAVLILKLLKEPKVAGFVTDEEVGLCVLPFAETHTDKSCRECADRVSRFRETGVAPKRPEPATSEDNAKAYANTLHQWLRYTGFISPGDKKGTWVLAPEFESEREQAVAYWSKRPLLRTGNGTLQAQEAFQRAYGLTPGRQKDNRRPQARRKPSEHDKYTWLVLNAVSARNETGHLPEISQDYAQLICTATGIPAQTVLDILREQFPSGSKLTDRFLTSYRDMAFMGQDQAREFEIATATVFNEILGIEATHVGQTGRQPDVVVRHAGQTGIIDTKAYALYGLESDHQLRMQTSYLPAYANEDIQFFLYIAGGFSPSFETGLRKIIDKSGIPGSGITIEAWTCLLQNNASHKWTWRELVSLFRRGSIIHPTDIL